MRAKINKRQVDAMRPGEVLADDAIRGFVVRRLASGVITYGFRYRDKTTGRQRWIGLGLHGSITADQARDLAKKRAGEVADKRDPIAEQKASRAEAVKEREAKTDTVDVLLDEFMKKYVRERGLRGGDTIERIFERCVRPRIGKKPIHGLRRSDITQMLDAIATENGPVMADRVLAHVRKAFNWKATRDSEFNTPIAPGMARTEPTKRARTRWLSDEEIRDLWQALDLAKAPAPYAAFVRTLILTGQRRTEVSHMRWEEIDGECWIVPAERYKTGIAHAVPVTKTVRAVLGTAQKRGFVFSTTKGKLPFTGYGNAKKALDEKIVALRKKDRRKPMPHWVLHDLRRTARSLMSRAGVTSDIAERVLGHRLPGVRGVYDRYAYHDEKRDALEKLAMLMERILHPAPNVVSFPATA
jgi:integrase